jgi:hypothetical protein
VKVFQASSIDPSLVQFLHVRELQKRAVAHITCVLIPLVRWGIRYELNILFWMIFVLCMCGWSSDPFHM